MLRLRVKLRDVVHIGDNVKVVPLYLDLKERTVELGFIAPKEIPVLRESFLKRKEKQSQQPETNSNPQ